MSEGPLGDMDCSLPEGHRGSHMDSVSKETWIDKPLKEDEVSFPLHYTQRPTECIDAIREMLGPEEFLAYCRGNVLKYTWRALRKDSVENNMLKAAWYATWAAGKDPRGPDTEGHSPQGSAQEAEGTS